MRKRVQGTAVGRRNMAGHRASLPEPRGSPALATAAGAGHGPATCEVATRDQALPPRNHILCVCQWPQWPEKSRKIYDRAISMVGESPARRLDPPLSDGPTRCSEHCNAGIAHGLCVQRTTSRRRLDDGNRRSSRSCHRNTRNGGGPGRPATAGRRQLASQPRARWGSGVTGRAGAGCLPITRRAAGLAAQSSRRPVDRRRPEGAPVTGVTGGAGAARQPARRAHQGRGAAAPRRAPAHHFP